MQFRQPQRPHLMPLRPPIDTTSSGVMVEAPSGASRRNNFLLPHERQTGVTSSWVRDRLSGTGIVSYMSRTLPIQIERIAALLLSAHLLYQEETHKSIIGEAGHILHELRHAKPADMPTKLPRPDGLPYGRKWSPAGSRTVSDNSERIAAITATRSAVCTFDLMVWTTRSCI